MANAFSLQNPVRLRPASFCTPRPNMPSRCLLNFYFCILIPNGDKAIFFLSFFLGGGEWGDRVVLVLESLVGLHRPRKLQNLQY